jgi:type IV secretion system protein TrbE
VFPAEIREWLKVLRKTNCAVILAKQNLSPTVRSGILDVLVESCPLSIFISGN